MLLPDAREAIVTTCQELSRAGLVVGTAGNVSVRDGDLAGNVVRVPGVAVRRVPARLIRGHAAPAVTRADRRRRRETGGIRPAAARLAGIGTFSRRDGKADSAYLREASVVLVAGDDPDVRVSVRRMPSSG
jgi:hypothetical protein